MAQYAVIYGAGLIGLAVVADCLRRIIRPSSPPPVFNMEPLPPLSALADPQAAKGEAEAA